MSNNTEKQFNPEIEAKAIVSRIKEWFSNESGGAAGAVIGISGGKDSMVSAKLLCEALGKEKVFGVMMPNGVQKDLSDSEKVCETLGIANCTVNIADSYSGITSQVAKAGCPPSEESMINIAPRLRMTVLYAIGQTKGYRVIGTGNLSEKYVGYFTKWGDMSCDFNPLANLTTDEVVAIGDYFGLPRELVHKTPTDGLSGRTDEESIGFTYETLNEYIHTGVCSDKEVKAKIDKMHEISKHKRVLTGIPHP